MCPEIMSCLMKCQIKTINLAQFSCKQNKVIPLVQIKHFVTLTLLLILFDYLQWYIKQTDRRKCTGFLTVDMDPPGAVFRLCDVIDSKVFQVYIGKTGKRRKKHQSKGDRNKENQTQPVANKRFCSRLPLQSNSRERQDNARFPLPSHYLFRYLPEA